MDTVEPGRNITPVIAGRFITSDGLTILGADNKAAVAVLMALASELKKSADHRPVEILFTTDEESENTGAKLFDYSKLQAKKGIIADFAAPLGTVVLSSPAYARFTIEAEGTGSHAAFSEKAKSVLPVLAELLKKIKVGNINGDNLVNIGMAHAGASRNSVAALAVLEGEIRSFDKKNMRASLQTIKTLCRNLAKMYAVRVRMTSVQDNPAYSFAPNSHFIKTIDSVFLRNTMKPAHVKTWSCSDANIFNENNIQVVVIGDGTEKTHTISERIAISDLTGLFTIFAEMAKQ
jgi:tripeptide aminopeptidase